MLINLVNNIAFLVALVAAAQVVVARFHGSELNRQLVLGLLFGGATLLGMANPVNFAPGLIFDGRSIVLSVAGVVAGGTAAAIAAGMAAAYRYQLGGIGETIGIIVVLQSALLGVLARRWWLRRSAAPHPMHYFALGVAVQLAQLAAFTQFPERAGHAFIEQAWWVLLLLYPLATMLLCIIFRNHEQQLIDQQALQTAQEAMGRERVFLRTLIDTLPDLIWLKDARGAYLYCNRRLAQLFGASDQDIIGKTDYDFFDKDLADFFRANDRTAMEKNGPSVNEEEVIFASDGHREYLETTKSPMRDEHGDLLGVLGIGHDITERKASERALENSEKQLRFVLEGSELGFWDWDIATDKVDRNARWADMLGYTPGDMQQTTRQWTDFIHPDDRDRAWNSINDVLEGRSSVHRIEYRMLHKDGSSRWILDQASVMLRDADGKPQRMCGTHTDITARKQAEAELEQYRTQLENKVADRTAELNQLNVKLMDTQFAMNRVGIGIEFVDPANGRYLDANCHCAEMMGYTVEDMCRMKVFDIDPNFPTETFAKNMERLREVGHMVIETVHRHRDGHDVPVEISLFWNEPVDGHPAKLINFVTDISERKKYEDSLRQAREAAEHASLAKSTFLANMSHELRTPFHGILGTISLAQSLMANDKGKDLLAKAKLSTEHLLGIINDVLDISKIEADRLELEAVGFRLPPIIQNLLSTMSQKAQAKGITLHTDLPTDLSARELVGDPMRLAQVLINLAGNAVKFTERGSVTVRILAQGTTEAGLRLRFEVSDTGIGIAPQEQQRLFTAFQQIDSSTSRRFGGTGLGLAISKRLVDLMGGQIGVTSVPGQGSTFWFELTLRELPASSSADSRVLEENHEERLRRDHAGKRILLVEDEPINQEVSRMMLEGAGLVVDLAEDGKDAVRLAGEKRYDMILMDMQMPVMSGLEATVAIRAETINRDTPILAMTANAFAEDRARCLEAGMRDHIAKPVVPEQLYATLLTWLTTR